MEYVFGLHLGWMECTLVALETSGAEPPQVVPDRHDRSLIETRPVVAWTRGGALAGDVAVPLLSVQRRVEGETIDATHALYAASRLVVDPSLRRCGPLALLFRKFALDLEAAGFPVSPTRQIAICAPSVEDTLVERAMQASGLGLPRVVRLREAAQATVAASTVAAEAGERRLVVIDLSFSGAEAHLWTGPQPGEYTWTGPLGREALRSRFEAQPTELEPKTFPMLIRAWMRPPRPIGWDIMLRGVLPRVHPTLQSAQQSIVVQHAGFPIDAVAIAGDFAAPGIHLDLDAAIRPLASIAGNGVGPILRLGGADLAHGAARRCLAGVGGTATAGSTAHPGASPNDADMLAKVISMPINEGRRL